MTKKAGKVLVKNRNVRLTAELLETARDMHASGLLTDGVRDKITMRHRRGEVARSRARVRGLALTLLRSPLAARTSRFA